MTATRMISGEDLKYFNGQRFVMNGRRPCTSAAAGQVPLARPLSGMHIKSGVGN